MHGEYVKLVKKLNENIDHLNPVEGIFYKASEGQISVKDGYAYSIKNSDVFAIIFFSGELYVARPKRQANKPFNDLSPENIDNNFDVIWNGKTDPIQSTEDHKEAVKELIGVLIELKNDMGQ
jgi:hypothetical protein